MPGIGCADGGTQVGRCGREVGGSDHLAGGLDGEQSGHGCLDPVLTQQLLKTDQPLVEQIEEVGDEVVNRRIVVELTTQCLQRWVLHAGQQWLRSRRVVTWHRGDRRRRGALTTGLRLGVDRRRVIDRIGLAGHGRRRCRTETPSRSARRGAPRLRKRVGVSLPSTASSSRRSALGAFGRQRRRPCGPTVLNASQGELDVESDYGQDPVKICSELSGRPTRSS